MSVSSSNNAEKSYVEISQIKFGFFLRCWNHEVDVLKKQILCD